MFDSKSKNRDRAVEAVESVSEATGLGSGLHGGIKFREGREHCMSEQDMTVRIRTRARVNAELRLMLRVVLSPESGVDVVDMT